MKLLVFLLVMICVLGGITSGFYCAWRVGGRFPGFSTGMLWGSVLAVGVSMLSAHLMGAYGETVLGTKLGVPAGLFVGASIAAFCVSLLAGIAGALFSKS